MPDLFHYVNYCYSQSYIMNNMRYSTACICSSEMLWMIDHVGKTKTQMSKPESCGYEDRPTTCSSLLLARSSAPKLKWEQASPMRQTQCVQSIWCTGTNT